MKNIEETADRKLVDMYAAPLNLWGPEKVVYSVFGDNTGCKISVVENNTNGNIRIQVRHNTDVSTGDWYEYNEGNFIAAQVVHCRVTSTSSGGSVKLLVEN